LLNAGAAAGIGGKQLNISDRINIGKLVKWDFCFWCLSE
jgi:hypothetical protein